MATATISAPQHQVAMPAVDLRRFVGTVISSEGVQSADDLKVSQRAAGANMSVDVAAGEAYIKDDHAGGGGFYHAVWTAVENVPIAAAHATLPRIDRVVVRIRDAFLGDPANDITLFVVQGNPTAGANLQNLNGANAVPGSSLLLANVLVPAADTSINDSEIDTSAAVRPLFGIGTSGTTYRKTTEKDVVNTTSLTDLLNGEITVGAGALGGNGMIVAQLGGDYLNNTAAARTIDLELKSGSTVIWRSGVSATIPVAATRRAWRCSFLIQALGATNSQFTDGDFFLGEEGGTTGLGIINSPTSWDAAAIFASNGPTAIDMTVAQALSFSVAHSVANASLSMRLKRAFIQVVNS